MFERRMDMSMENIKDIITNRRSVRTYENRPLTPEDKLRLEDFSKEVENPYGIRVSFRFLNAEEHELTCPVVTGTSQYIGGKIKNLPFAFEAFGYSFEMLVLYAHSIGIGTVWLGGTMNRPAYEKAMMLADDEIMPCASPIGYPAKKMSLRESMMRKAIKADERLPFEALFFDGAWDVPLTAAAAGTLSFPLEMVRLAPSAVNKQPWRVIVEKDTVHFYLKRSRGFGNGATLDMQKIDMGIALCHFALAAKENALYAKFIHADPSIAVPEDAEYIASYQII